MATKTEEINLPVINAVNDLNKSNTDNRQRLQKSLRAGLLNVKKSVDNLAFSFERSIVAQSAAQKRLHDSTIEFQEKSLDQGKQSGQLFMSKMTALGAAFVAIFEQRLLKEFKTITNSNKEFKDVLSPGVKLNEDQVNKLTSIETDIKSINRHVGGSEAALTDIGKNIGSIKDAFDITPPDLITEKSEFDRAMKEGTFKVVSGVESLSDNMEKVQQAIIGGQADKDKDRMSAQEQSLEDSRKPEKQSDGFWKKMPIPKKGSWLSRVLNSVLLLGAGILAYEHWDDIKDMLVGIKDGLRSAYIWVSDNFSMVGMIVKTLASLYVAFKVTKILSAVWLASTTVLYPIYTAILTSYAAIKASTLLTKANLGKWLLRAGKITGIIGAIVLLGHSIYASQEAAREEYKKTDSVWKSIKVGAKTFHETLATDVAGFVLDIATFLTGMLGAEATNKALKEINRETMYDDMKKWSNDTIKNIFDWVKDSVNAAWDWLFPDPTKIKQSVMSDPNINWPIFKDLTPGLEQAIKDGQGGLFKANKDTLDLYNQFKGKTGSATIPSGNGSGLQLNQKGVTGSGSGINLFNTTGGATSTSIQTNHNNSSTFTSPLLTQPAGTDPEWGQSIGGVIVPY